MNKWTLPKMKDLSRYNEIIIDTETNGLEVWQGNRTIGTALGFVRDDGTVESGYYAYGHDGGQQYSRKDVMDWLRAEIRNKKIYFHNATFDLLMLLNDGLDLRQYDNEVHDTMFRCILINPNSWYDLNSCMREYVDPNCQKIDLPFPKDEMQMHRSDEVGPYAEQDVFLTRRLDLGTRQLMIDKKLETIYRLECDCISATVEMMNNGLLIDTNKLDQFITGLEKKLTVLNHNMGTINPNSAKQLEPEFKRLGIPLAHNYSCPRCTKGLHGAVGWPSFTQPLCTFCRNPMVKGSCHFGKQLMGQLDHPFVKQVREVKNHRRLMSAFLQPWSNQLKNGNILPFKLNQLRDRDFSGSTKGTVTGRFSAEMLEEGSQPQQVWSAEKQIETVGPDFILRELFIASPGAVFGAIDASQIEFRLLAHFARTNRIADSYIKDPYIDYHVLVQKDILQSLISRKQAKNVNFGRIYGMGLPLFSRTMEIPFDEARYLYNLYDEKLPEAKETDRYWERQARVNGYLRTIRGRLFEFGPKDKTHIAMSRLIQGSAGDLMKEALVKLYRAKLFEKLRCSVHDEGIGCMDPSKALQMVELLNDVVGIRVPLRWQLSMSNNWAMTGPETVMVPSKEDIKRFQAA